MHIYKIILLLDCQGKIYTCIAYTGRAQPVSFQSVHPKLKRPSRRVIFSTTSPTYQQLPHQPQLPSRHHIYIMSHARQTRTLYLIYVTRASRSCLWLGSWRCVHNIISSHFAYLCMQREREHQREEGAHVVTLCHGNLIAMTTAFMMNGMRLQVGVPNQRLLEDGRVD